VGQLVEQVVGYTGRPGTLINCLEDLEYRGQFLITSRGDDSRDSGADLVLLIKGHMSKEELKRIGLRTKRGVRERNEKGCSAGGLPYGFTRPKIDPRTGEPTLPLEGGFARAVDADPKRKVFPRTDPAVMVLVTDGADRCLLARQHGWPPGMYSALAGFVEPGETLEECVVRETGEEVGLSVRDLRYCRSQAWPFPASLMIGFRAVATPRPLTLDPTEIEDARWVRRDELRNPDGFFIPPRISLAHRLIQDFLAEG